MNSDKERILILSGELGDGHKQAANALLEASNLYRPGADVRVVDFMALTSPRLHNVSKYLYLQGVKAFPSIYGFLYRKTKNSNSLTHMLKMFHIHGISRLLAMMEDYKPTVVVSTFPIAAAAMSLMKVAGMTVVPAVTVITDHTDHRYWLHEGTDLYIVGSNRVREALMHNHHIPDHQIAVTGIPVRASFSQHENPVRLRQKYDLRLDLPTVLLMGGGYGMIGKGLIELLASDQLPVPMQFIIVCGHNQKLKHQLEISLANTKHRVIITGYIHHVHEFMACADLIVTKPGGLTTSEALAMELPMLLYRALPGQEQDNARFLLETGVAVEAEDEFDLQWQLTRLFRQPQLLMKMRNKTRQFSMHNASRKAIYSVLEAQYMVGSSHNVQHKELASHA